MSEQSPPTPPVVLSGDGQALFVDGTWYRLGPGVVFSPDRRWVLVRGTWRVVQQLPGVPTTESTTESTTAASSGTDAPSVPSSAPARPGTSQGNRGGFSPPPATRAPQLSARTLVAVGLAGAAAFLGSVFVVSGGASGAGSPTSVRSPVNATSHRDPHALSGSLTVYAPYSSSDQQGKCVVSSVAREYVTNGGISGLSYPEPAPSRFPDLAGSSTISVKNADGAIIATGALEPGVLVESYDETAPGYPNTSDADLPQTASISKHGFCQYSFDLPNVEPSDFYQVQFGNEAPLTVSRTALDSAGWQLSTSLGDKTVAKQETDTWYENLCLSAIYSGGTCDLPAGAGGTTAASGTTGA